MDKLDKISATIVFGISFLFYYFTLAPTVLWGDSAKLALYAHDLYLELELCGNHPLHAIIGRLFSYVPIGDFAYTQNLMSAFFGSLSLVFLFFIMRKLGIRRFASLLAAFSLGVSHTFWLVSVINESYTLSLFFISVLLLLFLVLSSSKRNKASLVYLFSFLFGLSLTNSLSPIFLLPGILYFFIVDRDKGFILKRILPVILCFIAGNFLWIYIFLKSPTLNFVRDFTNVTRIFGYPENFLKEFLRYPAYLFYQFPFLAFFIGLIGIKECFRSNRKLFVTTIIFFVSFVLFSSNYILQRKFFILSSTYLIFAIYIGYGIEYICRAMKNKKVMVKALMVLLLILVPLAVYRMTPIVLHKFKINPITIRTLPYRDNLSFYFWPNKRNEYGARRYAEQTLQSIEAGGIILEDFTPGEVLRYLQVVEGLRRDVRTCRELYIFEKRRKEKIRGFVDNNIERHKIYLADDEPYYEVEYLREKYDVVKHGVIYEVRRP